MNKLQLRMRVLVFTLFITSVFTPNVYASTAVGDKATEGDNPLLGSWKMASVTWKSDEATSTIEQAQPGIVLFTPNSYSIMWIPINGIRTPFKVLSKPTDEEAIFGFKSVVFNAGSYERVDGVVTTKSYIAKVPGFEGGLQFYRFRIDGDVLRLTMFDEVYPDGTKPDWSGVWETEFVLNRVK